MNWKNQEQVREYKCKYYIENREKFIEKASKWSEKNREKCIKYKRKWRENNREKHREISRDYYQRNRFKYLLHSMRYRKIKIKETKAQSLLNDYYRQGKIEKQEHCIICNKKGTEAHHHDYDKPLDVIWVCKSCHKYIHQGKTPSEILDIKNQITIIK